MGKHSFVHSFTQQIHFQGPIRLQTLCWDWMQLRRVKWPAQSHSHTGFEHSAFDWDLERKEGRELFLPAHLGGTLSPVLPWPSILGDQRQRGPTTHLQTSQGQMEGEGHWTGGRTINRSFWLSGPHSHPTHHFSPGTHDLLPFTGRRTRGSSRNSCHNCWAAPGPRNNVSEVFFCWASRLWPSSFPPQSGVQGGERKEKSLTQGGQGSNNEEGKKGQKECH